MDTKIYIFIAILICKKGFCRLYRYNSTLSTWNEAERNCRNNGGSLVDGSFENQLINCTEFPQNSTFWIGTYDTFSPWIQILGCLEHNSTVITTQHLNVDNAVLCADNCGKHFGLMNGTCFCFPDDKVDYVFVDDYLCTESCLGNNQDSCGGSNHITVYRQLNNSEVIDRADESDKNDIGCGLVECTDSGWKYFGYSCNQSLPAYCNDKNKTSANRPWENGQETCWDVYNSFLMGPRISDEACTNETSRAPVWVGLYRRKIIKSVKEEPLLEVFKCFSGILRNGVLEKEELNCAQNLPFACELDTDIALINDCNPNTKPEDVESTVSVSIYMTTTVEETTQSTSEGVSNSNSDSVNILPRSSDGIETGVAVAVGFALAVPVLAAILTIICHCLNGKRPIIYSTDDDSVNFRSKETFYIRPASDDMSEINPRYSLFENDEEVDEEAPIEDERELGRVSTFVICPKEPKFENRKNGILINPDDVITKL